MSVTLRTRALFVLILSVSITIACASLGNNSGSGPIRGNKRSMIYHWPGCPDYDKIAPHNRVPFHDRVEAEKAGYRAARNCH